MSPLRKDKCEMNFGSWQPIVDAAPGRAKDYCLAKFDPNSTLDADQICRYMNDEEWDYVESNAGSVCCKIGMRRRRERMQGQTAGKWSETIFEATKARTAETFLQECAIASRPVETLGDHRVVFININQLYEQCLDADGCADREKVKDIVRGVWRIGLAKARQVQYIFALYRQRVVGAFHVARPPRSLADERASGFPGYPEFLPDVRRMDRFKSSAPTLAAAKRILKPEEYAEMVKDFQARCPDKNCATFVPIVPPKNEVHRTKSVSTNKIKDRTKGLTQTWQNATQTDVPALRCTEGRFKGTKVSLGRSGAFWGEQNNRIQLKCNSIGNQERGPLALFKFFAA